MRNFREKLFSLLLYICDIRVTTINSCSLYQKQNSSSTTFFSFQKNNQQYICSGGKKFEPLKQQTMQMVFNKKMSLLNSLVKKVKIQMDIPVVKINLCFVLILITVLEGWISATFKGRQSPKSFFCCSCSFFVT